MSWKSLVCTGMLSAMLAAPALAQPSLVVDLMRDGSGRPVLDANGDWQWLIQVDPDESLFGATEEGTGGATAIEIGFRASDAGLVGASFEVNNFGDINEDGVVDPGEGAPDNPGNVIFGWEELTQLDIGPFPVGLQTNMPTNEVFAALGSRIFLDGTDDGPQDAIVVTTEGPSTTGSLITTLDWLGVYSGDGGVVVQQDNTTPEDDDFMESNPAGTQSHTAFAGDANLDGITNVDDLTLLAINFGNPATWATANFNGDEITNVDDLTILAINFGGGPGTPPGAGSAIPEPASLVLIALGVLSAVGHRVRR